MADVWRLLSSPLVWIGSVVHDHHSDRIGFHGLSKQTVVFVAATNTNSTVLHTDFPGRRPSLSHLPSPPHFVDIVADSSTCASHHRSRCHVRMLATTVLSRARECRRPSVAAQAARATSCAENTRLPAFFVLVGLLRAIRWPHPSQTHACVAVERPQMKMGGGSGVFCSCRLCFARFDGHFRTKPMLGSEKRNTLLIHQSNLQLP